MITISKDKKSVEIQEIKQVEITSYVSKLKREKETAQNNVEIWTSRLQKIENELLQIKSAGVNTDNISLNIFNIKR